MFMFHDANSFGTPTSFVLQSFGPYLSFSVIRYGPVNFCIVISLHLSLTINELASRLFNLPLKLV